jgi:hypothetical protein
VGGAEVPKLPEVLKVRATRRIVRSIRIHAPAEVVWREIADFGSVAAWAPAVEEAHCTSEVESGVGARRQLVTSTGDVVEEVITEWADGQSFTFVTPGGMARVVASLQETWSVAPDSVGSVVRVLIEYDTRSGPVGAAVDRLLIRRTLEKMLTQNLAGLKHRVETGESVTRSTDLPVSEVETN